MDLPLWRFPAKKTFIWSRSLDQEIYLFTLSVPTEAHSQWLDLREHDKTSLSYIDMITPTKIPFRYDDNTPVNCVSTHTKIFIVIAKVRLIFLFAYFHGTTLIRFHISPPHHTFCQHSNIHSTNMYFTLTRP